MKRYVEQLLEDIEVAQNNCYETIAKWEQDNDDLTLDDMIDPSEDQGISPEKLFGIDVLALPPESYLDDDEAWELSLAISQLWRSHGLYPIFTLHLPKRVRYSLFRDFWQQQVFPIPGERVDVEMCDFDVCDHCHKCPVCKSHDSRLENIA